MNERVQRYDSWEKIPKDVIKEVFENSPEINFSARPFNQVASRSIAFGGLGWWLPWGYVLAVLGTKPQELRPVFNLQRQIKRTKKKFPLNFRWFGLNKDVYKRKVEEVELPENVESFEGLGYFSLDEKYFLKLAKILDKSVNVLREDGGTGEHMYLFTATPSGGILVN